jgi:hypothetical protein
MFAAKAREAVRLLAPFCDPDRAEQVAGCPELEAELIEAHGHALALDRMGGRPGA